MPFSSTYTFYEAAGNRSPLQAGFSFTGGRAVCPYYFVPETDDLDSFLLSLHTSIILVLGSCKANGEGGLERLLPVACPLYPWLTAERISSLVGLGQHLVGTFYDNDIYECEPIERSFAAYPVYQFNIEFLHQPYKLISDGSIQIDTVSWYDEFNDLQSKDCYREWLRYTDYTVTPQLEVAYAQHGQMVFRVNDESPPDRYTASGFPKIAVPQSQIQFNWYQVPFSYIDSAESFIVKYLGRINFQSWLNWPAASLLYVGVTVNRRYPPPVPEKIIESGAASYSTEKLCDLSFTFLYTSRTVAATPPSPVNNNWIADGWNTLPWLGPQAEGNGFYYSTRSDVSPDTDESVWMPLHLSFPFELLFQDPDA